MEADASPRVTIMVPTHRRARDLLLLLASLQRSGHIPDDDVELLVIDNNPAGSEESSAAQQVTEEFDALWISGPGPKSMSLNAAAHRARGAVLVFLDDDTAVNSPCWLKELVAGLEPGVGYVAGNVKARQQRTRAQLLWEAKGGLSKGQQPVELRPPNGWHTNHAWRLKRVAAGANCAIPRDLFLRVGGFSECLGAGTPVEGGETLEIVDRILRAGFVARYVPGATVVHEHPASLKLLRAKLRSYARGDTAMALHLAFTQADALALAWAVAGHQLYRLRNLALSLAGRYPLPPRCAWMSFVGSIEGLGLYPLARLKSGPTRRERTRRHGL